MSAASNGPDPAQSGLEGYAPDPGRGDVYATASPAIAARWQDVARAIRVSGADGANKAQAYLKRHVEDLGLAFRLTGDQQERPWPLTPMPIIIAADEWRRVEDGLIERAELLEAVIADLYGEQKLVSEGKIPAPIVAGSKDFARKMVGVTPPSGQHLYVYGVDLARGPTGEWRILADRVRLPTGIGYAIENRIALSRGTGSLLASIGVEGHNAFLEAMRGGIAARCPREDPRIALLTPGPFNQSYPEQAHLARYLGFPLVEGRDLTVRDSRLYVRSIAGLKRIDALWRWIDARNLDPLAFDSRSQIGVTDLFSACDEGQLVVANWPGSGVVEARAMAAILPRLARTLGGARLKLPNAATWWCGQERECAHVLRHLDELVISSAFRNPVAGLEDARTRMGASFVGAERDALIAAIRRRPMDYVGQEIVHQSTTPCLVDGQFEPRAFTIRTFLTRDADGQWTMMPGGFARISQAGALRAPLMRADDLSADVCIVEEWHDRPAAAPVKLVPPRIRRAASELTSQAADNLFWLGRYAERTAMTARVIRTLLATAGGSAQDTTSATVRSRISALLAGWHAVNPGGGTPEGLATVALGSREHPGAIIAQIEAMRRMARLLREHLTADSWRIVNRGMPIYTALDSDSLAAASEILIDRISALSGLVAENMGRSWGWRFLEMGMRIERASACIDAARRMIPGSASADDLSALLDLFDCRYLYRGRYLAIPFVAPVLDMILLDPNHPRTLAFQIGRLQDHIAALPSLADDGMAEAPLRLVRAISARIAALDATKLDDWTIGDLGQSIRDLSDAISHRFFLPVERPKARVAAALPE
ncbi:circularly permuted type 2 ATP-grasp protein [Novosphingobium lentum]|uniref:circularly permuted type 2 ATP-grasp protein n=1 Tax=Novosphingobium lentum TaxID=145287 RepID=UPI000A06A95C|nr:circularly permuted type 2 ATP-grasp protein [Novosphingobium lentum]